MLRVLSSSLCAFVLLRRCVKSFPLSFLCVLSASVVKIFCLARQQFLALPPHRGRKCRSSAIFPCCRRICANTVAVPVSAAAFCGAKFAIQRRVSCLSPAISATIPPIYADSDAILIVLLKTEDCSHYCNCFDLDQCITGQPRYLYG